MHLSCLSKEIANCHDMSIGLENMDGFVVSTGNVFMTKTRVVIVTSKFVALNFVLLEMAAILYRSFIRVQVQLSYDCFHNDIISLYTGYGVLLSITLQIDSSLINLFIFQGCLVILVELKRYRTIITIVESNNIDMIVHGPV